MHILCLPMQGNAVHSDHLSDVSILIWRGDHHHGRPCHPRHPHSHYWHSSDHLSDCLFAETVLYLSFDKVISNDKDKDIIHVGQSIIFIFATLVIDIPMTSFEAYQVHLSCETSWWPRMLGRESSHKYSGGRRNVTCLHRRRCRHQCRHPHRRHNHHQNYPLGGTPQNTGGSSGSSPASASPLFEFPNTQTSILVCWKQAHWYLAGTSFLWKDTNQCHHRLVSMSKPL